MLLDVLANPEARSVPGRVRVNQTWGFAISKIRETVLSEGDARQGECCPAVESCLRQPIYRDTSPEIRFDACATWLSAPAGPYLSLTRRCYVVHVRPRIFGVT